MENSFTRNVYEHSPIFLQNLFVSLVGLKNIKNRYGKDFEKNLIFLNQTKQWSKEKLFSYQFMQLKNVLKEAFKKVPYYKNLAKKFDININQINTIKDLEHIPLLTKEILREHTDNFLVEGVKKNKLVKLSTSGTSGKPLDVYFDQKALNLEYAFFWSRNRFYVNRGDKYATFNARNVVPISQKKPPFWRINYADNQILFSQYHTSEENLYYYAKQLKKIPYQYYLGYPSFLTTIANYFIENNIILVNPPKAIFTGSESLLDHQREKIQKAFGAKVFDLYGQVEKVALITQCEYGNYHINEEYGLTEILTINEDDDYIYGELVATGFINSVMPLIRYKTGDRVIVKKNNKMCKCGYHGRIVQKIEGRIEDVLVLPDGSKVGRMDQVFKGFYSIKEAQIIQYSKDSIDLKLVIRDKYTKNDEEKIKNEFKKRISKDLKINFKYVNFIEREKSGKFKAIKSYLGK